MDSPLDSYEDVVLVYIGLISQDSPQAAAAIEQIQAKVGTQAALRSALIITILRIELRQHHWIPDRPVYAHLLHAYPQAVPLLEYAIGCCLVAWGIRAPELGYPQMSDLPEARPATPEQ